MVMAAGSAREAVASSWPLMIFLGGLYITCSASLISFNKFLMHEDRFPYAVTLVMLHMAFAAIMAQVLKFFFPSLFPSLTDPETRIPVDAGLICKSIMPIAILFSGQLALSNQAYMHSSVAFLQMMKEANLVLVYLLSLFVCLEVFKWRSIGILLFICGATTMTIAGEVHFSMTGFMVQGSSQLFECCKIVLQALVLSAAGKKLDAMSYVLLVTPFCFMVLCCASTALYFTYPQYSFAGAWPHLTTWWPYLIANSIMAFCLNVVITFFIKHSSAVAFILAGIVKDVIIVAASTMIFAEHISALQALGFGLQLVGILVWSLAKTFPDRFADGLTRGLARTFCGYADPPKADKMKGYGSA